MSHLARQIEAILFVAGRPVEFRELKDITGAPETALRSALNQLDELLLGHGLMLQMAHHQYQLVTSPDLAATVSSFLHPELTGRLSQAALETLAIVAYKQPVARSEIERVRSVNCESILANLEQRKLITEAGRGPGPGQPKLYATTLRFMQAIGLRRLEDLPPAPTLGSEL